MKLIYIPLLALLAFSCSKNEEGSTPDKGSLKIEFDNRVGTAKLNLNTTDDPYTNALGQQFKVTTLAYYISNIKLLKADGSIYEDPVSEDGSKGYYLINEADPESVEVTLNEVPAGEYTGMTFTIGVDASQVSEGTQTGALDMDNNMFWNWDAGYIFLKFEGTSPQSTETDHMLVYHVGGYKSDPANASLVDNIKEKTVDFQATTGSTAHVSADNQPELHYIIDVRKFFEGHHTIDFSSNASRHTPAACTDIADNYVDAFVLDHIHD